jgi:hypothetical protein
MRFLPLIVTVPSFLSGMRAAPRSDAQLVLCLDRGLPRDALASVAADRGDAIATDRRGVTRADLGGARKKKRGAKRRPELDWSVDPYFAMQLSTLSAVHSSRPV